MYKTRQPMALKRVGLIHKQSKAMKAAAQRENGDFLDNHGLEKKIYQMGAFKGRKVKRAGQVVSMQKRKSSSRATENHKDLVNASITAQAQNQSQEAISNYQHGRNSSACNTFEAFRNGNESNEKTYGNTSIGDNRSSPKRVQRAGSTLAVPSSILSRDYNSNLLIGTCSKMYENKRR